MMKLTCLLTLLLLTMTSTTFAQSKDDTTKVEFTTNFGNLTLLLFEKESPITVKNFLAYVDSGYYNGLIFHRVIPGFMVQAGGFLKNMTKRPPMLPPIQNESDNDMKNVRGTIAMARTSDPNSATSQFFINVADNRSLDYTGQGPGYAVFGKVIDGMDVVDKIEQVRTETRGMFSDVPVNPVVIITAKRK
jgi:peptidyl-prolyl cis-trans isomerase A (cyclophilin A)